MVNVLAVDDNLETLTLIEFFLTEKIKSKDINLFLAEDCVQARDILHGQRINIDLMFLDVIMPKMDGHTFLKEIADDLQDMKVIMMSGDSEFENIRKAMNNGAHDFIKKPLKKGELEITINKSYEQLIKQREDRKILETSYRHLQKVMTQTIQLIAGIVELKDPYTAGHQRRVARLAQIIAEHMDLPNDSIQGIYIAGLLHDIGKIVIPTEILSKPGRLSEHESILLEDHTIAGYDILKAIDFPWPIANIIYMHHEKLDGSGYPRGISGDEIPLETRIISVADVFEATASFRPYRPSLGIEKAISVLEQKRGVELDANVVDVCVKLFKERGFTLDMLNSKSTYYNG